MNSEFAKDVLIGLTAEKKQLSSKYFYDNHGSRIFQEIMQLEAYYPASCELEILTTQTNEIIDAISLNQPFNVIELGAGDGSKTLELLRALIQKKYDFTYIPIDISEAAIDVITKNLSSQLPTLNMEGRVGDYFEILQQEKATSVPSLLLFLGGNIGNYDAEKAISLLQLFNDNINVGDKLLIGMDLRKNPNTIRNAYFDPEGITKRFNMNLLTRMNRELDANFDLAKFDFYSNYNPENGKVLSYLISLEAQEVSIAKLNTTVYFKRDELIATELSKKYTFEEIEELATASGFTAHTHFMDSKSYFVDSLWEKN